MSVNDWGLTPEQASGKGTLRTLFVGKIHGAMTTVTDSLTQLGYLSQEQNKLLTALKGELLRQFNSELPSELASIEIKSEDLKSVHDKEVSAVASPFNLHGPGSLLGIAGMGHEEKKMKKKDAVSEMFPAVETKEADGQGGYLVEEPDGGPKHLPTTRNGKPDRGLAAAAHAALFETHRGQPYQGPNKAEAKKKLKALYDREGWDWPANDKEAHFAITKDKDDRYRWIMFSSSSFEDRDGEILTQSAQEADVAHMNQTKEYGDLGWWHVGERTVHNPNPSYPLLSIGDCDFAAMNDAVRIESGHFANEQIGAAFAAHVKELSGSLTYLGDPNENGEYATIRTVRRVVLPKAYASNLLADLSITKEATMPMEQAKVKELASLLGEGGDQIVQQLLTVAGTRQKAAQMAGLRQKAAQQYDELRGKASEKHEHKGLVHFHAKGDGFIQHEHPVEHSHAGEEHTKEHLTPKHEHPEGLNIKGEKELDQEAYTKACGEMAKGKEVGETVEERLDKIEILLNLVLQELEQAEDRAGVQESPEAEQAELLEAATKEIDPLKARVKEASDKIAKLEGQVTFLTKAVKILTGEAPEGVRSYRPSQTTENLLKEGDPFAEQHAKENGGQTVATPAQSKVVEWVMSGVGKPTV